MFNRKLKDWILDLSGILVQGTAVPYVGSTVFALWLRQLFPDHSQVYTLNPILAFLIPFTLIDYIYYWNHRILHGKKLWFIHSVHHSSERVDILMTSRNVIWAPMLLIYIYAAAMFSFILTDPTYFLMGTYSSSILDVWRHSGMTSPFDKWLGKILILPYDHAWHHSLSDQISNYGANLILWDQLHGTFVRREYFPLMYGVDYKESFWRQLFLPKGHG